MSKLYAACVILAAISFIGIANCQFHWNNGALGAKWQSNCDWVAVPNLVVDMRKFPNTRAEDCGQLCRSFPEACNTFSWHGGTCYLKLRRFNKDEVPQPAQGGICGWF